MTKSKTPTTRKGGTGGQRSAATLRSTSGVGFEFEDLISAWLQVKMLAGEPTPAVGGGGTQIQAQVSALGWHIDDLLLSAVHGDGAMGHLAISAKGNLQVTAAGLPADFVERAWEQWRASNGPMVRRTDALALVTRGTHAVFDPTWKEVKDACLGSDIALALSRIQNNVKQLKLFNRVRKSAGTPADATDEETVELIRHLYVLPVDFQLDHSEFASQAIAQCRQLLASGTLADAEAVWKSLVNIAADVRMRRGTLKLADLWSQLRKQYSLRDHPDFARDWRTLADITGDYKAHIETELPSGFSLARSDVKAKLEVAIKANLVTVVMGESGTGKSALAKSVLDERFSLWTQVWLGPDDLRTALSAARRGLLPLQHELGLTLNASKNSNNILVLDSAERIDRAEFGLIRKLTQSLLPATSEPNDAPWRIIIITQTQSWVETAETMLAGRSAEPIELSALQESDVNSALWATPSLGWLTGHRQTVSTLTNLRTLAWVVKAGPALGSNASGLASHTAIADRLWDYWTDRAADIQALMMRLAKREAEFERSFPLTNLDPAESAVFSRRPKALPLRLNRRTNHVEFEHDLAADWARFQFLKQIAHNTAQWVALAENPLWTNALRMLGQFLLRQPAGGRTAWDDAFEGAKTNTLPLAGDILLDALCLDPEAERLLTERVGLLLADNANNLTRMLIRFRHIATLPMAGASGTDSLLGLYMEARFRSIIVGRWPPVLRFLVAQRDKLGDLVSPALAKLCETWLNGTPRELEGGGAVPWRKEVTEIALRMARTVQFEKGAGVMYLMDELVLYTAPLAGAADMATEVSAWALEMAGRRKIADDVAARIASARCQQAKERAERLKSDPAFREREKERHAAPVMIGSSREKLPPWPLGAKRRVDTDFRKSCLKDSGLLPLMRATPSVAAEVLLALIIEDEPYHEYGSRRFEIELGLEFAQDGYPAIFWKSPFFQFFQIAPNEALGALIALVNFCTERWLAEVGKGHQGSVPGVTLQMGDGTAKHFVGTSDVFDWTQAISNHNGNLFSALDALERWLTLQLDAGADIAPHVETILSKGTSAAFVGLLTNVGKYRSPLFAGILSPLLTSPLTYYWDNARVEHVNYKFAGFQWIQAGNSIFEIARAWTLAPHRKTKLLSVAVELVKADNQLAERIRSLIPTWKVPDDSERRLQFRLIFATLDRGNYELKADPETNEDVLTFICPEDLQSDLTAWNEQNQKPIEYLRIPDRCEKVITNQRPASDEEANYLHNLLGSCEADTEIEPDTRATCRLALAATLIVCSEAWLTKTPDARKQVLDIVRAAILDVGKTLEDIRKARIGGIEGRMKFAAYAAMHLWLNENAASTEWEELVLRLLTSGHSHAVGTIVAVAYFYREQLGSAWWRLLYAGLLWSALVMLAPSYEDDEDFAKIWSGWLARLRRMPLRRKGTTANDLCVGRVAKSYGRLDYAKRMRAYESGKNRWHGKPRRRWSAGLDTQFLGILFNWLINGRGTGDWSEDSKLAGRLWAEEAEYARAHAKDDGEYHLPSQNFGYDLLVKLAALAVNGTAEQSRSVWEPVLSHGPAAHYALRHFAQGLFMQLSKDCDIAKFESVWRAMAEYGLNARWEKVKSHWYYGEALLCDILGFGNESALRRLPAGAELRMRDVYERWSKKHLDHSEDNLKRLCHFLATTFGAPLRLDGLRWIAGLLKNGSRSSRWYRNGTGDALIELLSAAINENASELAADPAARQALVEIAAELAGRKDPTALALQERIKLLR